MNLLLPFDHRFFRAQDGGIFSDKAYQHSFFQSRYLQVFEHVYVLARVQDVPCAKALTEPVEGPGVTLLALPDWNGSLGFLRHRARIVAAASEALRRPSAVIMIGPGGIGSLLFNGLRKRGRPIGLEIVGDHWDAFQPGAIRHPLRPVLRWHLTRSLRKYCASAAAASYVTNRFLQERYPCPSFSIGVSDVVLPDSVFVGTPRRYAPATCRTAICVAVINGYKGHDVLIDALANSRGMGIELRLVLVGDGPLQGEIQCRVEQKGLCESVRFAGQLPSGAAVREELGFRP